MRETLAVATARQREMVDLTPRLAAIVERSGVASGWCRLFTRHTTAAVTIASLEPGAAEDLLDAFHAMVPDLPFRHSPPDHVPAHILSAAIGVSADVPVADGRLWLGEFQRVVLVELDGPRDREVMVEVGG